MRLFVAVSPPPDVKQQLEAVIDALRVQGNGRFTEPENLHMTLVFLGETDRLDDAISVVDSLSADPFILRTSNIGCFGDLYWLGMQRTEALSALQRELENGLRAAGFSIEAREFIPHITLARRFVPAGELNLPHVGHAAGDLLWPVNTITLMESRQENGRSEYLPLYTKELRGK